jgi:hypothetical protein
VNFSFALLGQFPEHFPDGRVHEEKDVLVLDQEKQQQFFQFGRQSCPVTEVSVTHRQLKLFDL